jgi:hypothetical protein
MPPFYAKGGSYASGGVKLLHYSYPENHPPEETNEEPSPDKSDKPG